MLEFARLVRATDARFVTVPFAQEDDSTVFDAGR
jgi:hypothetical protein